MMMMNVSETASVMLVFCRYILVYNSAIVVTIFTFSSISCKMKRARLIICFLHKTRLILLLIKISESFEIQDNFFEILRNKQSKKIVTTYPKFGVSCYSTWCKLLHLIIIILYRQFGRAKHNIRFTIVCGDPYVGVYMCHFVCFLVRCFVRLSARLL